MVCSPKFGYGEDRSMGSKFSGKILHFDVELIGFEKGDHKTTWDDHEYAEDGSIKKWNLS